MQEKNNLELIDYLILLVKWKRLLIILAVLSLSISYACIYFFIPEGFDAKALIVPSEQDSNGGLSSLLKGFSSLPIGGNVGNLAKNKNIDLYNTIIYSRTNLETIIKKFNLISNYGAQNMEEAVKILKGNIKTSTTEENAFEITARGGSRQQAADITNFIVDQLNQRIIDLNVSKSRDNRMFLETRYNDIKKNLKIAEDSLKKFQMSSGMFQPEGQTKVIFEAYSKVESQLAEKQIELSVYEKILGKDVPQVKQLQLLVDEYKQKVEKMKNNTDGNQDMFLSLNSLPEKGMTYLRLYRDTKIYNTMLEFIIPLYEQSRFEEQKDLPILKVIDRAIPPEKRSYPPRSLVALIITIIILSFVSIIILLRETVKNSSNPKVKFLREELRIFRKKTVKTV